MFIVWHNDLDYGIETPDQDPKDDLDSPSGCHEDGKLGLDSVLSLAWWPISFYQLKFLVQACFHFNIKYRLNADTPQTKRINLFWRKGSFYISKFMNILRKF